MIKFIAHGRYTVYHQGTLYVKNDPKYGLFRDRHHLKLLHEVNESTGAKEKWEVTWC